MESRTLYASLPLMCLVFLVQTGQQCTACPMNCYCSQQFTDCTALMKLPMDFPLDTKRMRLTQFNIRDIPPKAFSYLKNLTSLEFKNANIANVHGCAFSDMPSIKTLFFNQTVFGNIEQYAFSNLKQLDVLRISNSRIGRIKSFAFYNIKKVNIFMLEKTHVRNFYTHGMYDFSEISMMIMTNNNISDFVTGALTKVRDVSRVEFHYNHIWNMHCGVLDDIFKLHTVNVSFVFTENTFYCNCSISWLMNSAGHLKYGEAINKSTCHGPDNLNTTALFQLEFPQLGCKTLEASDAPACQRPKLTPDLKCAALDEYGSWKSTETKKKKTNAKGENSADRSNISWSKLIVAFLALLIMK